MNQPIYITRTETANVASLIAAFERLGHSCVVSADPFTLETAQRVVLPGVGTFAAAREALRESEADRALSARLSAKRATLAICLGFQLLFESSDESPGVTGLGHVPGHFERFPATERVPHLGWNRVWGSSFESADGSVYFANSYRLVTPPAGWDAAYCDYGGRFVAAVQRGPVLGCQFHPELSGRVGREWLRGWLSMAMEENTC